MAKRSRQSGVGSRHSSVQDLIASSPEASAIFDRIKSLISDLGSVAMRTGKSQIAFRRRRGFAWVWVPGQYLRGDDVALLVLSIALCRHDGSPRWKEVVEPRPGHFMHHMELQSPTDVDSAVERWVKEAWAAAA
jgi:hypothetical protein